MLLNILQGTGQLPQQRIILTQMSSAKIEELWGTARKQNPNNGQVLLPTLKVHKWLATQPSCTKRDLTTLEAEGETEGGESTFSVIMPWLLLIKNTFHRTA